MTSLEPTLSKIPEKIQSLHPAASRRKAAACLAEKIFFTFFDFARAVFFLLKGKENFSARLRAHRAGGGATLRLGRGGIPPTPPFRRALAVWRKQKL